jgi:hypothetical protein
LVPSEVGLKTTAVKRYEYVPAMTSDEPSAATVPVGQVIPAKARMVPGGARALKFALRADAVRTVWSANWGRLA